MQAIPLSFIPVEMRRKLPAFSLESVSSNSASLNKNSFEGKRALAPEIQRYRRFYKLDFESRMRGLEVIMGTTKAAGFDLVIQAFVPPQPKCTVFIVHGYYDHVGIYNHLIKALLKAQCAVVAFDLPGHGLSSGSRASVESFRQYQPVLKRVLQLCQHERLPKPWHLVAQSTGCAIVGEYLAQFSGMEKRIPFSKVVFYAPLLRPVHWFWNSKLHSLVSPFTRTVKRKFNESSNDEAFVRFVRERDPLQPRYLSSRWVGALKQWVPYLERQTPVKFPLLIIQGKCDRTVDWEHNIPVYEHLFTGTEVQYMAKVRHHVVNELELYRRDVFARTVQYFDLAVPQSQRAFR